MLVTQVSQKAHHESMHNKCYLVSDHIFTKFTQLW